MTDLENNNIYTTEPTTTWNMPDLLRSKYKPLDNTSGWTKNPAQENLLIDDKNLLSTSQCTHTEGSETVQT